MSRRDLFHAGVPAGLAAVLPGWPGGSAAQTQDCRAEYVLTEFGAAADDPSRDVADAFDRVLQAIRNCPAARNNGATIVIPNGSFFLRRPVVLSENFVTVRGANYGWRSVIDAGERGGSRIVSRTAGPAFHVPAQSSRISGLTFKDFLIDGEDTAPAKLGIKIDRDNDAVQVLGMACIRLGRAVEIRNADAALIHGNQIAECRGCLYLVNTGKSNLIANNRLGAQPQGVTCFLEGQRWTNVTGNNLYPDGYSNLVLKRCGNCAVVGNHIRSFYVGAVYLEAAFSPSGQFEGNNAITIQGNQIMAVADDSQAWKGSPTNWDGRFGVVQLNGNDIFFSGNAVYTQAPADSAVVLVRRGSRNIVSNCQIYSDHPAKKVVVDGADTSDTSVVDCAREGEVDLGRSPTARVRYLP